MEVDTADRLLAALAVVLRRRRRAGGLTQEELAHRANRSIRYISLLETRRHQPTLETMFEISRALGISLEDLARDIEQEFRAPSGKRDGGPA